MSVEQFYNLQYPPKYTERMCLGGWNTEWLNLHATITMVKIDHTIRLLLTHTVPPAPPEEYAVFLSGGEGIVCLPLPALTSLEEEAK